ncbi:MAG: msbA, partial [Paenibacillus sp.]|nr:msbA [Paenibacillus sp.]
MPSPSSDKASAFAYLRSITAPYRKNILLTGCLITVGTLCFMTPPLMTKYILEQVLPQNNWGLLLVMCLCTVIVPIIGSAVIIVETYLMRFALYLGGQGRADLFNGFLHRPLDWMQQQRSGDLITRTLDDTEEILGFLDNKIWWMLWLVITIIIGSIVLLSLHVGLAALILVLWAAHAVLVSQLGRRVKRRAAESARQTSRVTESIREVITGAAFIKATGQEQQALVAVEQVLHNDWKATRKGTWTNHLVEFVNVWLHSSFLVVLYLLGGKLVVDQQITIGAFIAFLAVYNWLQPFGIAFFETFFASMKVVPALDRIMEIASPVK